MTYSRAASAELLDTPFDPRFESRLESYIGASPAASRGKAASEGLSYREAPDGSVTMGTDLLSGQVVLIVQNGGACWEIALPPKIARFAASDSQPSLAAAKRVAEAAFEAYHRASSEKN